MLLYIYVKILKYMWKLMISIVMLVGRNFIVILGRLYMWE